MKLGLIGGYGLTDSFDVSETTEYTARYSDETIDGESPVYTVRSGTMDDTDVLVVPRHGQNRQYPPHNVPFKSYVDRLSTEGVDRIITVNSVGVLDPSWTVPAFHLMTDFVNLAEEVTFYEEYSEEAIHTSMADPYDESLNGCLRDAAETAKFDLYDEQVYVNTEGPRLETAAEIRNLYSPLGDVIGMTGGKEAILANEKQIPIATIGLGVNEAEGLAEPVIADEVVRETRRMQDEASRLIERAVANFLDSHA